VIFLNKIFAIIIIILIGISNFFIITFSLSAASDDVNIREVRDFNSWEELETEQDPGVRICALMVYDSESDKILIFGGFDGSGMSEELWAFDYETKKWTNKTPSSGPLGRCGQGFIYDSKRDLCIMFGGVGNDEKYYNDTWKYDYNSNTWTELFPVDSPSPRCKGGIAYDSKSDRIIWFGGYGPDKELLDETWAYNYKENTWLKMTPNVSPQARQRNPMMYDGDSDRVILFGGWVDGDEVLGDTWAYDFDTDTWTNMNPTTSPKPRARFGRAYDPTRDVILYTHGFGGKEGDFNDTWVYDYNNNKWTEFKMRNTPPPNRHCFQIALNTKYDVILLYGGHDGRNSLTDTWLLTFEKPDKPSKDKEKGFIPGFEVIYFLLGGAILVFLKNKRKNDY
jgi:hypothetical protein